MAPTGKWQLAGRSGVLGTSAALLHTGQILFFSRPETPAHRLGTADNGLPGDNQRPATDPDVTLATLFERTDPDDPTTYQARVAWVEHNPFCAGLTFLADGRLLVAGGDKRSNVPGDSFVFGRAPINTRYGVNRLRAFAPNSAKGHQWQNLGKLIDGRWYPTCTLLADGRVFVISGSLDDMADYNTQSPTFELVPPAVGGAQYLHFLAEAWPYHSYPFVFLLPTGQVFVFVKDRAYYLHEVPGQPEWAVTPGPQLPTPLNSSVEEPAKQYPNSATAVLLPLLPENKYAAEVLLLGGSGANVYPHWKNTAEAVDLTAGNRINWRTYPQISSEYGLPLAQVSAIASARRWQTRVDETGQPQIAIQETFQVQALANCFRLKVHPKPAAAWQPVAAMHHGRVMLDAVLLPDGTVLALNGSRKGFAGGYPGTGPMSPAEAVLVPELYDPQNDTWQLLAEATCPRLYHSTALLLPDARVLVAGSDHQVHERELANQGVKFGDPRWEAYLAESFEYRVEVFSPPYLSQGPRPIILASPEQLSYGREFELEVEDLSSLDFAHLRVALLRPGAVTHGNNMSQRHVGLHLNSANTTHLSVQGPPDGQVAPPGYYMLFLMHAGVPSQARFVQVQLAPVAEATPSPVPRAGLHAWLRADLGIMADSSRAVSSWSDLSGQGNHVFWRSSTKPGQPERPPQLVPQGLNGQPVVRFALVSSLSDALDPQGGHLESVNKAFLPGTGPYTILVVAHPWPGGGVRKAGNSPEGVAGLVGWGDYQATAANAVVALCLGPGPQVQRLPTYPGQASLVTYWDWRNAGAQLGDELQAPVSQQRAAMLASCFDGTNWWMRINGQTIHGPVAAPAKDTGVGPLTIGRTGAFAYPQPEDTRQELGEFFRGDIAEVLIYDRDLTETELQVLEAYLRNRYSLS